MNRVECERKLRKMKEAYKDVVSDLKWVLNDITVGDEMDYEKILDISKVIVGSIDESSHVIKCITELKDFDEYTYIHSINVAFYSMLIARWMELPEFTIQQVIQAGLLHDIGKVKISNEILNKPGKLTSQELQVIKRHTVYGYNFIKDISYISESIKKAVLLHHERMDGSGYPFGYSEKSIGLLEKIVSVADVYDAMTQDRVYKKKVSPFDAFEMFLTDGKSMFDATVLEAFLKNMAAFYVGSKVTLSNGYIGEIVYVPPQDILNPIISVGPNYIDLSRESSLKVLNLL